MTSPTPCAMTQAIILAAGRGSRLAKYTDEAPKAFLPIKYGTSIIERMLQQLAAAGIRRVVVVVGYKEERALALLQRIRSHQTAVEVLVARNPDFSTTGSLKSFLAGYAQLPQPEDDFLVVEGDVVCDAEIISLAASAPPNALLVDAESQLDEEAMRFTARDGRIVAISKTIPDAESDGEYFGVARFDGRPFRTVFLPLALDVLAAHPLAFLEEVVDRLGRKGPSEHAFRAIDVGGRRWTEIDFPEEYKTAREMFAEAVEITYDPRLFTETSHSPSVFSLARDLDVRIEDFCFLANPYIAAGKIVEQIKLELRTLMANYPPIQRELREAAAAFFHGQLPPEALLVGNGATELVAVLGQRLSRPIVPIPTYSEYLETAAGPILYELGEENGFDVALADLIAFGRRWPEATSVVLINPNNPAGRGLKAAEVFELSRALPDVKIIVDECFIEFADPRESLMPFLLERPQLILVKSFGKILGVPGVRLGVMAAHPDTLASFGKQLVSWNVNSVAAYVLELLKEPEYRQEYEESIRLVRRDTQELYEGLRTLEPWLKVFRPSGNFALVRLRNGMTATELRDALLKERIYVRDCSNKVGLGSQFVRIASRTSRENQHLIHYLQTLLIDHERVAGPGLVAARD